MPNLRKLEQRSQKAILARERYYEREVQRQLRDALDTIRGKMARIYDKYSVDGALTKAEMTRYNRFSAMEKEMLAVMNETTRKNLRTIDRLKPEQYGESFFRYAWAIDNAVGVRLNYGPLNRDAIIAVLDNEFYRISRQRYGMDARLQIRQTLAQGVAQGASYPQMSRELGRAMNITASRAMRILRTEGQDAANTGQDAAYIKAQEEGIDGAVIWDATLDGSTRPTHQAMDGQERGEDGLFNGPGANRVPYPAHESLPASERIFCRCNMRFQVKGFEPAIRRSREDGLIPYQKYSDWKSDRKTWK